MNPVIAVAQQVQHGFQGHVHLLGHDRAGFGRGDEQVGQSHIQLAVQGTVQGGAAEAAVKMAGAQMNAQGLGQIGRQRRQFQRRDPAVDPAGQRFGEGPGLTGGREGGRTDGGLKVKAAVLVGMVAVQIGQGQFHRFGLQPDGFRTAMVFE